MSKKCQDHSRKLQNSIQTHMDKSVTCKKSFCKTMQHLLYSCKCSRLPWNFLLLSFSSCLSPSKSSSLCHPAYIYQMAYRLILSLCSPIATKRKLNFGYLNKVSNIPHSCNLKSTILRNPLMPNFKGKYLQFLNNCFILVLFFGLFHTWGLVPWGSTSESSNSRSRVCFDSNTSARIVL